MPPVDAAAVHEHAVQLVQVAHALVRVRVQVLVVSSVQVQQLGELVPLVDLCAIINKSIK